jgi:hypothetical protein
MSQWKQGIGQRRMWKAEEFDGLKPTTYDWCRLAAFIDGEGNLNINPGKTKAGRPRFQVRVLVGNTNPVLPVWLKETFGGNIVLRINHVPSHKDAYIWSCTSGRAAWILHNALPWFLLKQAQAKILIELQEHVDMTRQGRGRTVTDDDNEYRVTLKDQLHVLNAKGREVKKLTGE